MAHDPAELLPVDRLRRRKVPLVRHQHHADVRVGNEPGDVRVLRRQPLAGVDQHERDVRPLGRRLRPHDGVLLDAHFDASSSPDSCRVD